MLDDDAAVLSSLKFSLEIEGFEVRGYSSPADLLNEANVPASSCLVIDYLMPVMNGLELIARLRGRGISVPAILITAHSNESVRKRAAAAGIPIVDKPFIGTRLFDCIREAFDRQEPIGKE